METIADIVTHLVDNVSIKLEGFNGDELVVLDTKKLADRIIAAHKREVVVAKMETTTPGNAAKLREALEKIKECYENDYLSLDRDPGDVLGNAALLAENALAEPPRNCDRRGIKNHTDAVRAFCHEQSVKAYKIKPPKEWCLQYSRWLFAEAKGGAE